MYNILLANGFIDNKYFQQYITLIEDNKQTKAQKYKTQKHHVIPKCIAKKLDLQEDIKNLTVNLLYKDHILAHYLLCLCCIDKYYKYLLISAFQYLYTAKASKIPQTDYIKCEENLMLTLDNLQALYEEQSKLKSEFLSIRLKGIKHGPLSEQTKEKLRKINLGKKMSEETKLKLMRPHTEEWKQQNSLLHKGRIHITDGIKNKSIKKEDLEKYLAMGWQPGYVCSEKQLEKLKSIEFRQHISDILLGHAVSDKTKEKISINTKAAMSRPEVHDKLGHCRGKHWYNNGEIESMYFDGEQPSNYIRGRLIKNVK